MSGTASDWLLLLLLLLLLLAVRYNVVPLPSLTLVPHRQ